MTFRPEGMSDSSASATSVKQKSKFIQLFLCGYVLVYSPGCWWITFYLSRIVLIRYMDNNVCVCVCVCVCVFVCVCFSILWYVYMQCVLKYHGDVVMSACIFVYQCMHNIDAESRGQHITYISSVL